MKHLLGILLIVLVAGCVTGNAGGGEMAVKKGDHVFVEYTGTLDDGTEFDSSVGREPLEFDAGAGQMIKGFDAAVIDMKAGDEKTVRIEAEDAYGTSDNSLVIDVPKSQVPDVKAGDTLYARGQPVKVLSVANDSAKIDFNHPLAGQDLTFRIKLIKIGNKYSEASK